MKVCLGRIPLYNRAATAWETAEIYQGIDDKNLADFERLWKPLLTARRAEFSSWTEAADANAQDSHWEWTEKVAVAATSLQYETFALECCGDTQGLMLVDMTKFARAAAHRGH